jgi:hypothetical protein
VLLGLVIVVVMIVVDFHSDQKHEKYINLLVDNFSDIYQNHDLDLTDEVKDQTRMFSRSWLMTAIGIRVAMGTTALITLSKTADEDHRERQNGPSLLFPQFHRDRTASERRIGRRMVVMAIGRPGRQTMASETMSDFVFSPSHWFPSQPTGPPDGIRLPDQIFGSPAFVSRSIFTNSRYH